MSESCCSKLVDHIPVMSTCSAVVILIINIFLPGWGTILMTCCNGGDYFAEHILVGLIQFFATPLLFGYIWSIIWGIYAITKSHS